MSGSSYSEPDICITSVSLVCLSPSLECAAVQMYKQYQIILCKMLFLCMIYIDPCAAGKENGFKHVLDQQEYH